jgi:hypothetical protein
MSRLQNNGAENVVESTLQQRLEPWVNNPPDYTVMVETYKSQGRLKAKIRLIKREIERTEDDISVEVDKPRSNEAKKQKLAATSHLRDELADLEAELELVESDVKALEFMKTMFNAANYRTRLSEQYA